MDAPTKDELQAVGNAVEELRHELKSVRPDQEKLTKIDAFLDTYEENVNQPLVRAQEERKNLQENYDELKAAMVKAGETEEKATERIQALELTVAAQSARATADNPDAYRDSDEFKALNEFVRIGDRVTEEQKALLRTDGNAEGGYLVPSEMDSVIVKKITEVDPIRSIARVRTISGKSINLPVRNSIPLAAYEAEAEEGTESASGYKNENITPFRQTFTTPITWDMLQDAAFDMESEIMADAAEAFAFGEGQGFVTGSGEKEPFGFLSHPTLQADALGTGVSADISPEALIELTGELKQGYDPVYVFNRKTLARIRKFRADAVSGGDGASAFLWNPGLNGPVANTINGYRYILANSMPDLASDTFSVAFGDFRRGYTIVDRTGLSVIRDDVTRKKSAIVEFTMHRWNTAQVTLTEPIKLLQCDS